MRLCEDWPRMQHSYLILSLDLLHKDWIQRLPNQNHHCPLSGIVCAMCWISYSILKCFTCFYVRDRWSVYNSEHFARHRVPWSRWAVAWEHFVRKYYRRLARFLRCPTGKEDFLIRYNVNIFFLNWNLLLYFARFAAKLRNYLAFNVLYTVRSITADERKFVVTWVVWVCLISHRCWQNCKW